MGRYGRNSAVKEASIEKSIVKYCNMYNILTTKFGIYGYPDRVFWLQNKKPILMELKTEKGIVSLLQEEKISKLRNLGYSVYIVTNLSDAIEILTREIKK